MRERPLQGQSNAWDLFPGLRRLRRLRPGLVETAFQAENSFTALPFRAFAFLAFYPGRRDACPGF
jgi:hypothetical protein